VTTKKSGRGERELKVRVKDKRKSQSSRTWLERQLNDPYVIRAKREGFRSRAAFKLIEIDDRHHLLKLGAKVADLGAAPGGWSQVAAKRVGARGCVVGIDILAMDEIPGVDFAQIDFLDPAAPDKLKRCSAVPPTWCCPHGGQRHRPSPDRSSENHGAGRSRGGVRQRGAQGRRLVPRQGDPGRHRKRAARRAQARLRHGEARQAGGQPRRLGELYVLATGFRGASR
jgi:23S rRNA (uridine2552-2'-O)-methyltransferase